MGGDIRVESQPDKGSTFTFTAIFEKQITVTPPCIIPPVDLTDINVLVVDDNASNRTILTIMVEGFGCRTTAISSGLEAVRTLRSSQRVGNPFQLVLLDMQMPEMDGEDTLKEIKKDPLVNAVKVIIMTSMGFRGDAGRLKALGCDGYLLKPIKQTQLREAISLVLGKLGEVDTKQAPVFITRHTIKEMKQDETRILLAEDNEINRKLVTKLLARENYLIDSVENGKRAFEAVKSGHYDLVLMDVQMPEMDGFEATKAIRNFESPGTHIPIIAMTAHALQGDRERCLEAGMDGYISKPIDPDEVFNLIKEWTTHQEFGTQVQVEPEVIASTDDETPPVDIHKAMPLFSNDKEFFLEMFSEFVLRIPSLHQELVDSLGSGDREKLLRVSHNLKGLAANFQATKVSELAREVEEISSIASVHEIDKILAQIKLENDRVVAFYQSLLPQ
jgi:two-component system sensor histidine kinase/response regulator